MEIAQYTANLNLILIEFANLANSSKKEVDERKKRKSNCFV